MYGASLGLAGEEIWRWKVLMLSLFYILWRRNPKIGPLWVEKMPNIVLESVATRLRFDEIVSDEFITYLLLRHAVKCPSKKLHSVWRTALLQSRCRLQGVVFDPLILWLTSNLVRERSLASDALVSSVLPLHLHLVTDTVVFKHKLKTELFTLSFDCWQC